MTVSANFYANYLISSIKYSNSRKIALEDSYLHVNEIIRLSLIQRSAHHALITGNLIGISLPVGAISN